MNRKKVRKTIRRIYVVYFVTTFALFLSIFQTTRFINQAPIENSTSKELIIVLSFCSLAVAAWGYLSSLLLKDYLLRKFVREITERSTRIYFHGFQLCYYIKESTFQRITSWLEEGLCYELSVLAMILLKDYHETRLCHGNYYDEDGKYLTGHSWVEVKVPLNDWTVLDFSWVSKGFYPKNQYFKDFHTLKITEVYTYDQFWGIEFFRDLSKAVEQKDTSYILTPLTKYCRPINDSFFNPNLASCKLLREYTITTYPTIYESGKPLSNRIIRDFIKHPDRTKPKPSSVRRALYQAHERLAGRYPPIRINPH